jgi:hypothetical protein
MTRVVWVQILSTSGVASTTRWENSTIGEVETDSVSTELPPRRRQKRFEQSTASVDEESISDDIRDSQKRPASKLSIHQLGRSPSQLKKTPIRSSAR